MRAIELIRFFCFTNWKISTFLINICTLSIQKKPKKMESKTHSHKAKLSEFIKLVYMYEFWVRIQTLSNPKPFFEFSCMLIIKIRIK